MASLRWTRRVLVVLTLASPVLGQEEAPATDRTISTGYAAGAHASVVVSNSITTAGTVTIAGGAFVNFIAGSGGISLKPGFHAVSGAKFHAFVDVDKDGMSDNWETAHGLNPSSNGDANGDADGDGASNLTEYRLGTNPNNASDVTAQGYTYDNIGQIEQAPEGTYAKDLEGNIQSVHQ